jgi:hypothetical protein
MIGRRYAAERHGSRSGERGGERGEDAEVGMEGDTIKPSHPQRLQAVLVLQPSKGTLDGVHGTDRPTAS